MEDLFLDDSNLDRSSKERNKASTCHIITWLIIGIPLLNLVVPFIYFKQAENHSSFLKRHAASQFNFQVGIIVLILIGILVISVSNMFLALAFLFATAILHTYGCISAFLMARNGHEYHFPFSFLKLLK